MAPVFAEKVTDVAAAATVTEAGTVRPALLSVSITLAPPAGAALVRVTVQLLEEFDPRLFGVHVSVETNAGATRLMVALTALPL